MGLYVILIQKVVICATVLLCVCCSACAQRQRVEGAKPDKAVGESSYADPALADIPDLVKFPSAEVEFIAGPQLKAGSSLNPAPWFDQTASSKGLEHGNRFPADPPAQVLTGSVSVTKGSKAIVGTNTRFRADFAGAPYSYHIIIQDAGNTQRDYIVASVEDDTHLTISVVWEQPNASGRTFSKVSGDQLDEYINLNYYDQGFCQYINYYRTGDSRFLTYARKIADSWWKTPFIGEGNTDVTSSLAPRNISLNGLILRALDGRPEMWPWITKFVREQFDTWVGLRVSYPGFYYGIRDPGYMILFAANLARVHPDPKVRAEFRQKALNAAVNYYARLQAPDGGFYFELDTLDKTTQPFQVGLLAEGLIAVHRLTGDETVKKAILKSAEHQYLRCFNAQGWRGMYYFIGGKTKDKGESCENGCGAAANRFPPADAGLVSEVRQLNGTAIHQFGYAYLISKDPKYRKWGDDIFDASFSGRDGYRGLAAARAKEYNESFRSAGKYLAWRLAYDLPATTSQPALREVQPSSSPLASGGSTSPPLEGPQEVIAAALTEAVRLTTAAASESEVEALLNQISGARDEVIGKFGSSSVIRVELDAAIGHLRVALQMLKNGNSADDSKLRIGWAAARLKRAGDRFKSDSNK
ncbi:MAG TPA: hypothetical protein VJR02_24220 [Pyrinomonadaceae bacterium]|nr:hypothetical protein [Pyrinomonadaceae bacterium]